MKILFYRYGNICEPDIKEIFERFGLEVAEAAREIGDKHMTAAEKVRYLADVFVESSSHGRIDFVFSIDFYPFISEFCERIRLRYVCWSVDCPVLELYAASIKNQCNRIFLFDKVQYLSVRSYNPENVFFLPLATNVERWDRELAEVTETDRRKYSADVSFVGSLYHEKSPLTLLKEEMPLPEYLAGYVRGIAEAQLLIYGSNFLQEMVTPELVDELKKAFPDFYTLPEGVADTDAYVAANYYLGMLVSEMERVRVLNALAEKVRTAVYTRSDTSLLRGVDCRGGVSTHVEMPRVFHMSKINLNITMKGIQSGLSLRIWDVLGCGGFLLTNYQSELADYFEIGKDLECYESIQECVEKAEYYLSHEDIRMEIAENGYRKVRAMHTYEHRVAELLRILLDE